MLVLVAVERLLVLAVALLGNASVLAVLVRGWI